MMGGAFSQGGVIDAQTALVAAVGVYWIQV